ncbi:MAG TPA: HEAT repeat domain-containing protein [Gemmatimonadaceae bacterium]|nr:HEAT repeat domain-containing protein [Gemmatimonadaceae bacterium]
MDYSLTFARHFARLVWLLLTDDSAFDAQIATLRSLAEVSKDGVVVLATHDWRLIVNGEPIPERFTGAQDLTAQLIGHSIAELRIEENSSPADLTCIARILASQPVPGDGGRNIETRLHALEAHTIHVKLETPEEASRASSVDGAIAGPMAGMMMTDTSLLMPAGHDRVLDGETSDETDDAPAEGDLVQEQSPEAMYQAFANVSTPKGSMVKLFEQLDAAKTTTSVVRQLDGLTKLATESAQKERVDVVADVVYGIVQREDAATDRAIRRQLGMAIRRLSTQTVLKCVAGLLPRRKENYEQYMAVFTRFEDAGVEALVDALISAPSIADRRMYFDSLLRLGTGVRTLIHMLGDPRWYVARNAAELLGEMRVTEAEVELTRLLDHRDDRVRTAAAGALAKLGTVAAAKGVRATLRGASADVRERAAEAVVGLGGSRSVNSLIRAVDREEDDRVQMAMLTALGQIGTPEAVEKLMAIAATNKGIFRRTPTPLRVAAVHALGEVKSASALAALQGLVRDKEKEVRGAASWVLMGKKRGKAAGK